MNTNTLANLIVLRNYLEGALNGIVIALSREEQKSVSQRIALIDRKIVTMSLALDLENLDKPPSKIVFQSTEPPEQVFEKMVAMDNGEQIREEPIHNDSPKTEAIKTKINPPKQGTVKRNGETVKTAAHKIENSDDMSFDNAAHEVKEL